MILKKTVMSMVSVVVTVLLATGCSTTGQSDIDVIPGDPASTLAYAKSRGWDDVVNMLADGVVTAEENAEAHESWKRCREEFGFTFGPSTLDPVNGKLLLETEDFRGGDNIDQAAHELCYTRYSDTVELVYQSTAPSRMDPALLSQTQVCLDGAGYARPNPGVEVKLKDFYAEGQQYTQGDPVYTCVEAAYFDLFPELPGLAYGFTLAD